MGLDITVYETVKLREAMSLTDWNAGACEKWEEVEGTDYLYSIYAPRGQDEGMPDGVYDTSGERGGFRAGSYTGYNVWREDLAALVGVVINDAWREEKAPGPFVELIDFADNEGFIGPKTSAKLAADFAEWEERAKVHAARYEWWYENYQKWRAAFETAARGGGVVWFH